MLAASRRASSSVERCILPPTVLLGDAATPWRAFPLWGSGLFSLVGNKHRGIFHCLSGEEIVYKCSWDGFILTSCLASRITSGKQQDTPDEFAFPRGLTELPIAFFIEGNGSWTLPWISWWIIQSFRREQKIKSAQARNRTGGPTMATLDFTTKPLALVFLWNLSLDRWIIMIVTSLTNLRCNEW